MRHLRARAGRLAVVAAILLAAVPVMSGTGANAAGPATRGYWFVAADGGIFSFGDGGFYGSTGDLRLNKPIVGMAPTPTGAGYWFVAADGGIFSFGDASFHGSTGALRLNKPIVGMAPTPTGKGYWFVAADGGMFVFGDAKFWGSTGNTNLRAPIVGMASTPSGKGYWLVGSDGAVYPFGDARFLGSMGGRPLALPVVGMAPTPSGGGYWLVAADGGIFSFGDASFHGSTGALRLNLPIVGMAAVRLNAPAQPAPGGPSGPAPTSPGGTSPTTGTTTPGGGTTPTTAPPTTTPPTTGPTGPPVDWGASGTTVRLRGSESFRPWMSADGRYLAYDSAGKRNVAGVVETDEARDIYVHDRVAGTTQRITKSVTGGAPDGESQRPTLSADGRFVAFWSTATNLVEGDTNGVADAFVWERDTGTIIRVSVTSSGVQGNGASERPVMSRDGLYVAFESDARNLVGGGIGPVGGGDSNNVEDVFVYSMATKRTTRVSVDSGGGQGNGPSNRPSISADGHKIAFQSEASNLVSGDTNANRDVFLHDLNTGQTTRVSVNANGAQVNGPSLSPSISADGNFVSFDSGASFGSGDNGTDDVYVKDLSTGAVSRASTSKAGGQANGDSHDSSISANGRFVAYWSAASDLVDGDTNSCPDVTSGPSCPDIYVYDRLTGTIRLASVSSAGALGNDESYSPALSMDGRFVAFDSKATNLFPEDPGTSGQDIFLHVN